MGMEFYSIIFHTDRTVINKLTLWMVQNASDNAQEISLNLIQVINNIRPESRINAEQNGSSFTRKKKAQNLQFKCVHR